MSATQPKLSIPPAGRAAEMDSPWIRIEGEIHSSKNSRRILINNKTGRPFVAKSKASKSDESLFSVQLASQRDAWEKMILNCEYPIVVVFSFRRATRRKFDYTNMTQGILDAMVKEKYIPDDCADYVIPFFVPYIVGNPGCDITVMEKGMYLTILQMAGVFPLAANVAGGKDA